jgi:tetratricopeptide (TPR) repeat protein
MHRSCGLCQDPMCETGTIRTLQALGRLAEGERVFVRCRGLLKKFTQDQFRNVSTVRHRRADSYYARLNYAGYRLASLHFDRAVGRNDFWAARLSFIRREKICSDRPPGQTYWFESDGELMRSRNLDLASMALIKKRPDRALMISREVLRRAEEEGHLADKASALLVMARSHFDFDEARSYSEAEICVREFLKTEARKSNSRTTSWAWRLLAEILIKMGRLDEAEQILVDVGARVAALRDVSEEVKAGALRAKFCNARGRTDEAIELWFQVLHKLTIASDAPSDDPAIVKAIAELKKANALSKSRLRALKLGPPARDSWLAINPFDRYWTAWFVRTLPTSSV